MNADVKMSVTASSEKADDRRIESLLLHSFFFARLLAFKDGVLAFHLCPCDGTIGQITNDFGQLANL